MADEILKRDQNFVTVLGGVTDNAAQDVTMLRVDPITKRLLISATGLPGAGTVTSVSVVTANGISGSVATATTTPAITLTLGAITPTSVNGNTITTGTGTLTLSTFTLTVGGTSSINGTFSGTSSGTNTGDQTSVSGNAGTATALQNARTIGGVSFNGTANITVASATGGFTVSGGDLVLSTNNITLTGSIGATGARATKVWAVDMEVTNAPTAGGIVIPTISSTNTLTNKRITRRNVATTQSATPVINTDNTDIATITALAQAITSFTSSLSGTPLDGDLLMIRITDDGTARAITWGTKFEASTVALPTTTVISTLLTVGFQYNGATSKWRCIATA